MPKHYGLKAEPGEIKADPTGWQWIVARFKRWVSWMRWNGRRLFRFRWR